MSEDAKPESNKEARALQKLLRAIASRDQSTVSKLLAESPWVAKLVVEAGATRADASACFFEDIKRYVYAGDTALHIAAAGYCAEIARELLARGANVRARNRRGAEPLHYASDGIPGSRFWNPAAQQSVVEFLVGAGADPNALDKSGVAPLHRAVRTRCTPAVRALLLNGADVRLRNKNGSTPLHLAVQNTGRGGSGSAISREEQLEIIRLLLSNGARPADKDSAGKSVKDYVKAEWLRTALSR